MLKCSALTSLNVLMMRISKWNFKKGVKIIIHDLYPYKRFKKITSHFKLKLRKTVKKRGAGLTPFFFIIKTMAFSTK